jgi:thiol-disulfide isomerase/thioredoxin
MQAIAADYADRSVQLVAISPNSPLGLLYEELGYTDLNDDYAAMRIRAEDRGFTFPYLYDGDTEAASLQYGPAATPHAYVFDAERRLVYTGRLDSSEKPGTANAEDLRAAIDAVLAGSEPPVATTQTFGCSTKWGWKTAYKEKTEKEWKTKPVDLEMAGPAEIEKLLANEDSNQLRLINIWATWCGPCVMEYPEFIALQRMYGARDFEFVSLSMDKPAQHDKALAFLEKQHSALRNLQFSETNSYALTELIGKAWNGALPYTLLIAPGGEVVWEHQGEVDFLDLKRTIVEHPLMGRYY